jgi:hypothetical protein
MTSEREREREGTIKRKEGIQLKYKVAILKRFLTFSR